MKKKVLVISHIFPPVGGPGVQRSLKFVKYLGDFGWEPVVLTTGRTTYPLKDESLVTEIPGDIRVIRIDENYQINLRTLQELVQLYKGIIIDHLLIDRYILQLFNNPDSFAKLISIPDIYVIWANTVLKQLDNLININGIDLIYSTSGPFSDHIIAYYLKEKYRKPWVVDFRDEWTNHPYAVFDRESISYKMQHAMENKVVHTADRVITVSPAISDNYHRNFRLDKEKVVTITNGYDEADFKDINTTGNRNDRFTIGYNGIFCFDIIPVTFLFALNNLINKGLINKEKIKVNFTCEKNNSEWCKFIKNSALYRVVNFLGYLSHRESLDKAGEADLLLLIIGKGENKKSVYSSKVFEYLRLNKPVLSLAPEGGVVDMLLKDTGRGTNVEIDNIQEIEKTVLQYYKNWEQNNEELFYNDNKIMQYERKNLTQKLAEQFNAL